MLVIAIVVGSISFFFLAGYKFYGGLIDRILVEPNDERKTPAHVHKEEADYDPAPNLSYSDTILRPLPELDRLSALSLR